LDPEQKKFRQADLCGTTSPPAGEGEIAIGWGAGWPAGDGEIAIGWGRPGPRVMGRLRLGGGGRASSWA